jgi:spore germination protein GerM
MKLLCLFLALLALSVPSVAQTSQTMTIKIYFHPDKLDPDIMDCQKIAPTTRTIPKTASVATAALQELFKGPSEEERKSFSGFGPPETNGILKRVKVKNGAAYVNFNKVFLEQMGNASSSCGGGFFLMIEGTLKQFPTIKNVYYAVEGNTNDFYEWAQVGECPHGRHCRASNF